MNRFVDQFKINPSLATNANASTGPVDVRKYEGFSIQCVFDQTGGANGAGNIQLQGSGDDSLTPVNWQTLAGTTIAYTAATAIVTYDPVNTKLRFIRVTTSGTSGTTPGTVIINFTGVWGS